MPGVLYIFPRVREPSVHAQPSQAAAQEAYKAQEGASVAFLNWRFELTQMTIWRIEVAPVPGMSNVATPQELSSPSQSLYMDMGMVMIREKGVPRDGAMGGAWGAQGRQRPSL